MLLKHKNLLVMAAWQVKKHACSTLESLSIDQQIYWSLTFLRHAGDPNCHHVQDAIRCYPYLSTVIGTLECPNLDRLCNHISTLHYNKSCKILRDGPLPSESADSFKKRSDSLARRISLWASKRHSIANIQISRPDGTICTNIAQSSEALVSHWAPVILRSLLTLVLLGLLLRPLLLLALGGSLPSYPLRIFVRLLNIVLILVLVLTLVLIPFGRMPRLALKKLSTMLTWLLVLRTVASNALWKP